MAASSPESWNGSTAFCADGAGHVYAVTSAGQVLVGVVDSADSSAPYITRTIDPHPALDFVVTHASASSNGQYLALAGFHEGGEEPALALLQLQNPSKSSQNTKCRVTFVDQQTYWEKPGLKFHQMQWHPYSPHHLAVLTSDLRFRLYNLHNLSQSEQVFQLQVNSRTPGYGLQQQSGLQQVTSFCFGPPTSWGFFTILFVTSTGELYSLCPVAPFGMICPAPTPPDPQEEDLPSSSSGRFTAASAAASGRFSAGAAGANSSSASRFSAASTTQSWLHSVLGCDTAGAAGQLPNQPFKVQPHLCDMTAALRGPLNQAALVDEPAARLSGTCRVAAGHYASYPSEGGAGGDGAGGGGAGGGYAESREGDAGTPGGSDAPTFWSALLTVDASGRACGYLSTQECTPEWVDVRGRSKEDGSGTITAVSYACERVACARPAVELLDVLDLGLGPSARGGGSGEVRGALARRFGVHEADEEEDDDIFLQLLGSSQELPGQFWLGHPSGVWLITLPWLQVVADLYSSGSSSHTPLEPLPSLPEITEHCMLVSASHSIVGIALVDLPHSLLAPGPALPGSCLCASLDVDMGVGLHRPMISLPDAGGDKLQSWGLPKGEELSSTVEAQHKRLMGGIGKLPLPQPPSSDAREHILKYLVEGSSQLTRHYLPFWLTAHEDVTQRFAQLFEETYNQADRAAALQRQLEARQQRQQSIQARVDALRGQLHSSTKRLEAILQKHNATPRRLGPQERQVLDEVLPSLEAHSKQLQSSWQRLQPQLQAALQQSSTPSHPRQWSHQSTPRGVPTPLGVGGSWTGAIGAYRGYGSSPAGAAPHTGGSSGSMPDSQAAKLFHKLEVNNSRLKDARRKLEVLEAGLQAHNRNKAAEDIALRLRPLAERDDDE